MENTIDRQPALHRQLIRDGLMTEEESERIVSTWEKGKSKCCNAPLVEGSQCENCGAEGR